MTRPRVEVYQDLAYLWWWRLVAADGSETARSEEGYSSLEAAKSSAAQRNPDTHIEVVHWHLR